MLSSWLKKIHKKFIFFELFHRNLYHLILQYTQKIFPLQSTL